MREYLESGAPDLHSLGPDGVRDLVLRLWERRKEQESLATDGFVADRSSYDFAAFWLYYRYARADEITERIMAETLGGSRYDAVFVLPWGAMPIVRDGVRSTDRWVQLHIQALIEGMVRRHALRVVDVTACGLDDRVAFVRRALAG